MLKFKNIVLPSHLFGFNLISLFFHGYFCFCDVFIQTLLNITLWFVGKVLSSFFVFLLNLFQFFLLFMLIFKREEEGGGNRF